ncbi:MAG TPA: peptidoglycan-associated lipoprotein Pal [Gemmatimonadaceae bacterium]|nr:peptidoglycan-associated lipoprotein Pal [Gemmatimonadaceae bacterium]
MIRTPALSILAVVTVAAVVGCHRAPPPPPPEPAPTVNQDSIDAARRAREDSIRADSIRRVQEAEAAARAERDRRIAEMRNTLASQIFFDYDSDALSAQAQSTLDAKLAILNANAAVRLRIAGNADERGSDEYNLALGQRRAAAAKRYLTQHGIADDRLEIVSYGEERPVCQQSDESCYQQNRRDEFEIIAGGDSLNPTD